jgi:hypothetical protein
MDEVLGRSSSSVRATRSIFGESIRGSGRKLEKGRARDVLGQEVTNLRIVLVHSS